MKRIALAAIILLLVLVTASLMFFRHTPFAYSGVIEGVEISVPSRINDVIVKQNFIEGTPVRKGDTLAQLECKEVNLKYDIAQKEFNRAATLLKTTAGSQENYDARKNRFDNAALAKSWCTITSPIDGKVLYKFYEEGEFIAAGRKIATVANLDIVDVWVYVEHDMLAKLNTGQKIKGTLPETAQNFEGVILAINDEAEFTPKNVQTKTERQRLVFGIKTRFTNDKAQTLKPGMTLEIDFNI